jgi:hypothetical protein
MSAFEAAVGHERLGDYLLHAPVFCKLAAALYGDKSDDLQYHCRAALRPAKIKAKNSPG